MGSQRTGNPTGTMPEVGQARRLDVPLTSNHDVASPLRYPGGKTVLSGFVATLIERLGMKDPTYVEPYAGGAGVALRLLRENRVSRIVINDYDRNVYAFWNGAVNHPADFLARFDAVEPTMEEWRRQRRIIRDPSDEGERGFAFFFLVFCQIEVVQNSVSVQSEKAAGFSPIERKTRRRCSSYPIRAWVRLYDSPSNLIILP